MGVTKNSRLKRHQAKNERRIVDPFRKFDLGRQREQVIRVRRQRGPAHAAVQYMIEPVWGDHTAAAGGTSMEVTIGPLQGGIGYYGSVPEGNTPSVMRTLLDEYPAHGWVAGHLLNDNLGGPGVAKNLTPLTTAGNKNHLNTCETLIKNTITACYSRTLYEKKDEYWYGVYYKVVVPDGSENRWGDGHPWDKVAVSFRVWAHCVRMSKNDGSISVLSAQDAPSDSVYFNPLVNVSVINEASHL